MPAKRATTTARGLGHTHRLKRAALPPPNGQPCPYCHKPMWPNMKLDADHTRARALGGHDSPLRWSHSACNRREGQRLGMLLRSRKTATQRQDVHRTDLTL